MKKSNIKSYIPVLLLLGLLLPGCIKENPVDPPAVDNFNPDPLYTDQWHLNNTGQGGGTAGEDINVEPVWNDGYYGSGVSIAIIDDGLDTDHEDLHANVVQNLNYNYLTGGIFVYPGEHGTSVAGVAAAVHNNPYGGRGAAPEASIFNYNLLLAYTSLNQLDAMTRKKEIVDISSNSWGPVDYTGQIEDSTSAWKLGIEEGLSTGRGGKGIIYTWAGGNGSCSAEVDNSNYDGYANHHGVIAVAAVTNTGIRSYYSERGANIWISAHSDGGSKGITTTDITGFYGDTNTNYTDDFGGTSSATPLVSGVIALILEANPDLTWRDVKLILVQSARQIDPGDSEWVQNQGGTGYWINYKYGFGVIDAYAAVELAKIWSNVGTMITTPEYSSGPLGTTIPDNNPTGISNNITISGSNVNSIEYVVITTSITHADAGDIEITLTSPAGTESILAESHTCWVSTRNGACYYGTQTACTYFNGGNTFPFGSARHLGESADGTWELTVKDLNNGTTGTLDDWSLTFYGR